MIPEGRIRRGHSCAGEAEVAVADFHAQVEQPDMALVLFFCSASYDLSVIAEEIKRRFGGVPVLGCTTAGEIGPAGYQDRSLSGLSFPAGSCSAATGGLDQLESFDVAEGRAFSQRVLKELEACCPDAGAGNSFGFLLIDGLSQREEQVIHALQDGLGGIRMVGGSAGDDLQFKRCWVFHDGAFHTDSAALVLVSTRFPFRVLKSQHFVADGELLVVTEVDAARRLVREINGLPAVDEYARLVGVPAASLTPAQFAAFPVVVTIGGEDYVRSIQSANADGSLTLYCAIDEGVVLRVAHGHDLVGELEKLLSGLQGELGDTQAMLVCDCVLRNLEASRTGQKDAVSELLQRSNAVGFSTYGEQYCGVHINQTLIGVAIGGS